MQTLIEDSNNPYGVHADLWRWDPVVDGPDFQRFLDASRLPSDAQDYLRIFTPRLLGQAVPPTQDGRSTGLVIGKVQSGKTNSFLGLAALASDNGYRIIIVLSGTKNLLKSQTYRQVVDKLSKGARGWMAMDFGPRVDRADFEERLRVALSPVSRRTLVITILKRTRTARMGADSGGIDRLAEFLESSDFRSRLAAEPVLIIDDEADEASLDNSANARRHGRASRPTPTFEAIRRLRNVFRRHLFVQYTATPQANLLVELADQLSPDFCELLRPGEGYAGAYDFFPPRPVHWKEIPQADLVHVSNRSSIPPASLVDALRTFYVGCALEDHLGDDFQRPRSMLVHPERSIASHRLAHHWVRQIRSRLLETVEQALTQPNSAIADEVNEEIEAALAELSTTVDTSNVVPHELVRTFFDRLQDTEVRLINSERQLADGVDWADAPCWIFIGGDVLQRGFAFEGLTTTWMARSAGTGQIDVLMQRARFLGYRKPYLQYCRVWLPRTLHDDYYALFADHEEALWRSLGEHLKRGRRLPEWSRVFWLDPNPALRLCRRSSQWFRLRAQPEWAIQSRLPAEHDKKGIEQAAVNRRLIDEFISAYPRWAAAWRPNEPNEAREHSYVRVSLVDVLRLLERYTFFGADQVEHAVVSDAIATLLEDQADASAVVVQMRPGFDGYRRGVKRRAPVVSQLLGGRSREGQPYYPGDREFHAGGVGLRALSPDQLTLQIHKPQLFRGTANLTGPRGYLNQGCPLLAVWLPEQVRRYRREDYHASR